MRRRRRRRPSRPRGMHTGPMCRVKDLPPAEILKSALGPTAPPPVPCPAVLSRVRGPLGQNSGARGAGAAAARTPRPRGARERRPGPAPTTPGPEKTTIAGRGRPLLPRPLLPAPLRRLALAPASLPTPRYCTLRPRQPGATPVRRGADAPLLLLLLLQTSSPTPPSPLARASPHTSPRRARPPSQQQLHTRLRLRPAPARAPPSS